MEMIFCPNCGKLTGYKRALGFGTFFAVLLTAGFWLLAIPFYPERCITCGLTKADSIPWYRAWLAPGVLVLAGVVLAAFVVAHFSGHTSGAHEAGSDTFDPRGGKFDEHMSTAFPIQKPPEVPWQALPEIKKAERRLFGERAGEIESNLDLSSGELQGSLAVWTACKSHDCPDHYAMWTVDLSTGHAAGAITNDRSEIVVYLGDYESMDTLPAVLQAKIEEQRKEGWPSPKRIRYISQAQ